MKELLFICSLFLFFSSCATSQADQETTTKTTTAPTSTPAKTVSKTAPASTTPATQSRVMRSTARPQAEIESAFPYDIDLKKSDGSIVNSADILKKDGRPTIVLFWLTTCYPCRMEMKAIKEKYAQWVDETDFRMVAISTDFSKNYDNFVKMVDENGWEWETYNDVNREFRSVMPGGLNGLPQTFVIDKDGEIIIIVENTALAMKINCTRP